MVETCVLALIFYPKSRAFVCVNQYVISAHKIKAMPLANSHIFLSSRCTADVQEGQEWCSMNKIWKLFNNFFLIIPWWKVVVILNVPAILENVPNLDPLCRNPPHPRQDWGRGARGTVWIPCTRSQIQSCLVQFCIPPIFHGHILFPNWTS